jgi:hypothetical protein
MLPRERKDWVSRANRNIVTIRAGLARNGHSGFQKGRLNVRNDQWRGGPNFSKGKRHRPIERRSISTAEIGVLPGFSDDIF